MLHSSFFLFLAAYLISFSLASGIHEIQRMHLQKPEYLGIKPGNNQAANEMRKTLAMEVLLQQKDKRINCVRILHLIVNDVDYEEATANRPPVQDNEDEFSSFSSITGSEWHINTDDLSTGGMASVFEKISREIEEMNATRPNSQPIFSNSGVSNIKPVSNNTQRVSEVPFIEGDGFTVAYSNSAPKKPRRKVVVEYGGNLPNSRCLDNVKCSFRTSKAKVDGVLVDIKDIRNGQTIRKGKWELMNDNGDLKITGPYDANGSKSPSREDDVVIMDSY